MIANNRRTETFDIQSLRVRRVGAIHFVTGWANECIECRFGVTNGRLTIGQDVRPVGPIGRIRTMFTLTFCLSLSRMLPSKSTPISLGKDDLWL
jgi:hypothetical protein